MISPDIIEKTENIYTEGGRTDIKIKNIQYFDREQYNLNDEKDFGKYIDDIERIVRNSYEYRSLISYLKETSGMDECAVLENITSSGNTKVRIEIHHSPLTLYDIVCTVVNKRLDDDEDMDVFAVAEEVLYGHYARWVGLIPLSHTAHELVHNAYLFIPTDKVFGNYNQFVNYYHDYIGQTTLDALSAAEKESEDFNNEQMQIFNNHRVYVQMPNVVSQQYMDNTKNDVKSRVSEIKNNLKVMCRIVDNSKPKTS